MQPVSLPLPKGERHHPSPLRSKGDAGAKRNRRGCPTNQTAAANSNDQHTQITTHHSNHVNHSSDNGNPPPFNSPLIIKGEGSAFSTCTSRRSATIPPLCEARGTRERSDARRGFPTNQTAAANSNDQHTQITAHHSNHVNHSSDNGNLNPLQFPLDHQGGGMIVVPFPRGSATIPPHCEARGRGQAERRSQGVPHQPNRSRQLKRPTHTNHSPSFKSRKSQFRQRQSETPFNSPLIIKGEGSAFSTCISRGRDDCCPLAHQGGGFSLEHQGGGIFAILVQQPRSLSVSSRSCHEIKP